MNSFFLHGDSKLIYIIKVLVSLAQLVKTMHNICKVWGSATTKKSIYHKKYLFKLK